MPKSNKKEPKRRPFQQRDIGKLYLKKCGKKLNNYRQNKYSDYAIQWPFRLLVNGKSGSGKNFLLAQMLTCREYLSPIDKLYIFSNSIDQELYDLLDKVHNKIEEEKQDIPEEEEQDLTPAMFNDVYEKPPEPEEPEETAPEEDTRNVILSSNIEEARTLFDALRERSPKDDQICVVFDDVAQSPTQKKILEDYWCFSRPNNISVILLTQTLSMKVPTNVRTNSTHYILFKPPNQRDMRHIKDNIFSDDIDIKTLLLSACTQPYDYLLVNTMTKDPERRFLKNWCIHLKPDIVNRIINKQ